MSKEIKYEQARVETLDRKIVRLYEEIVRLKQVRQDRLRRIKILKGETVIMPNERESILEVSKIADQVGYGNVIAHLKRLWALKLIKSGISKEAAIEAADVEPYGIDNDYLGLGSTVPQ